jgi:hypothetical protein
MNNLSYDDLFAYRLQLLDHTSDEYVVINRLKIKLLADGVLENELNEYVYNFYLIYDINITMAEIENVPIQSPFSEFVTQHYEYSSRMENSEENSEEEEDEHIPAVQIDMRTSVEDLYNLLNLLQNVINSASNHMEDVTITTDEKSLDKIQKTKITKEMSEKCTICMDDMKEGEEYYNLTCRHIFHIDCIKEYLLNYNHMCPLCKEDIGEKKINL